MLKKTFVITMFGSSFSWIHEFIDHVQHLGQYGWEWKIFTPNKDVQTKGNVEIIDMSTSQFVDLCERTLGVRPNLYITDDGRPSVHVTDFYVASGVIFADWLKETDYWGITNLDVVYGRLDHFIPDDILSKIDVMTDETGSFNGVFSLLRNREDINNLFKEIPHWREKFTLPPCPRCIGAEGEHMLAGTDEYDMSALLETKTDKLRYIRPEYYAMHSHDRLEQHRPEPKLEIQKDGSLWELFEDVGHPEWTHARPFMGREIGYFHFPRLKRWPNITRHDLSK